MVAFTRRRQDVLTLLLAAAFIAVISVVWASTTTDDDPGSRQDAPASSSSRPTEGTSESADPKSEEPEREEPRRERPLFVEDFEGGLDGWDVVGSAVVTDETSSQGRRSATLTSTECGGDAFSRLVPVDAGSTYRLRTDYRTDGGGGYIGVSLYDADGAELGEKWLIGDGGTRTPGDVRWRYHVDAREPGDLGVWARYSTRYRVPDGVASVAVKVEDWGCGGLPDDPAAAPVYFDRISWTLVS